MCDIDHIGNEKTYCLDTDLLSTIQSVGQVANTIGGVKKWVKAVRF